MKIYLDYVFFINFIFDFIILLGINVILKRNVKLFKIILGSFVGAISIFILFVEIPSFLFLLLKILFGLLMVIISFKYKDIRYTLNNFLYLMILSILIGGFLYMINIEVGYEHIGMVFFKNGNTLNIFILILLAILIIVIYIKKIKKDKKNLNNYYKVDLYVNEKVIKLMGFLDTGNTLIDPYFNKPVLILNKDIKISIKKFIFVPFKSLNNKGVLKCFIADKIYIENIGFREKVLIGISNDKITLSGVDIILNNYLWEE